MARHPEFDRMAVVDAALAVFWSRGFPGTSIKALEAATGLQPGSLYAAFGSKEGLFREALGRYVDGVIGLAVRRDATPRAQIRRAGYADISKQIRRVLGGHVATGREASAGGSDRIAMLSSYA